MNLPIILGRASLPVALLLATVATTQAQSTPPPPSAPRASEEVITLSAFNVSAESNRGYVASETMTGSRVATKIIDLPYTVNVLTSEFFEDFAMFDLNDTLTQIGNFTGLNGGGGFTLRGFTSGSQLRDGFFRIGRYGASNVDRIEIIKGSNAAIYGRTSPGGMINMISKSPKPQEGYRFSANYGDYGTRRGTLEATGPLYRGDLGQTSYILTVNHGVREFAQQFALTRTNEDYLALKHEFKDGSTLRLTAEYFLSFLHSPSAPAPLVTDLKGTASNLDDVAVGYAFNLARYSPYGPMSTLNRGNISYTAAYDRRLSSVWSARFGANYYRTRSWNYNNNTNFGAISLNPAVAAPITTTRANPVKQLYNEDGGGCQGDLLAHYWLANKKIENRTLLTIDLNDYYRYDPNWTYAGPGEPVFDAWNAAGSGRIVTLNPDYTPTSPLAYFPNNFVWGREVAGSNKRQRISVLGGLIRQQSALFDGRLLAYAGARFDAVRFMGRDFFTAVTSFNSLPGFANYAKGDVVRRRENLFKPNVGVNYKITPNLRAFANYSESYFIAQGDTPVQIADPTYKPEVAHGYDYGFKGGFLDDRLNFTVSGFYAIRENVNVSEVVENPVGSGVFTTVNRRDGDQLVRGYEIDVNWRILDELSVTGSWGHVYSIYTDFGSANPLAVGRRVNGVSPQNGGLSARYAPKAKSLRGFSANLGVTFIARTPTEAPNAGDAYTTSAAGQRVLQRTTRQWALGVPSVTLWNAAVRYSFGQNPKFNQTVALNLNNAFDQTYLKVSRQLGDGRALYLTYSLGFSSFKY